MRRLSLCSQTWQRSEQRFRLGFTLVELLVVIAVIAILAALLFPVFASVRARSKNEVCASNLRQIHLATMLYTHDYDGLYPYAVTEHYRAAIQGTSDPGLAPRALLPAVQDVLQPYTRNRDIFHCPLDTEKQIGPQQITNYALYKLSYFYDIGMGLYGETDSSVDNYVRHELADDVKSGWHTPGEPDLQARGGNVLFLDGHVRRYVFQQENTDFLGVETQ